MLTPLPSSQALSRTISGLVGCPYSRPIVDHKWLTKADAKILEFCRSGCVDVQVPPDDLNFFLPSHHASHSTWTPFRFGHQVHPECGQVLKAICCCLPPSFSIRHSLPFLTMAARTKRKTGTLPPAETGAPVSLPSSPQPTSSSANDSTVSSSPAAVASGLPSVASAAPTAIVVPAASLTATPSPASVNSLTVEESSCAVVDAAGLSTSATDNGSPDGDGNGDAEGAGVLSVVQPSSAGGLSAARYVSYSLGPYTV